MAVLVIAMLSAAFGAHLPQGSVLDGPGLGGSSAPAPSPSVVLVERFAASADAFIEARNPDRNFGASDALAVGGDPANASAYRSLLRTDLSSIPATAQILDATLRAHVVTGALNQSLGVHRVLQPWAEGNGSQYGYRADVTVMETAGVPRLREPVDLLFVPGVNVTTIAEADFRVYDEQGREVPSQIYGVVMAGPYIGQLHIVFPATVPANGNRTYSLYFGTSLPVVPAFRTKTLDPTYLWTFPNGSKYASLSAADLNGDGRLEVVFGSQNGWVYALQWNGTPLWTYQAPDIIEYFTAVDDVDGDGALEVLFMTTGVTDHRLYAINATSRALKWNTSATVPGGESYAPVAIADVDGDGLKELFFGSRDGNVYAINGSDGSLRWSYPLSGSYWGYGAAVGNLTGDAAPEIVFTASTGASGTFYVLTRDGTYLWDDSVTRKSAIVTPSLGDFERDGDLDVVAGDTAVNGDQFAMRGTDGSQIWRHGSTSDQYGGQILVDFDDDGRLETVFAMTRRNQVRAVNDTGFELWTYTTGGSVYGAPAAADVNRDGVEDILVGSMDTNLHVIDATGAMISTYPAPDIVTATPIVADLDGDGTMEIVFSSRTQTYAYPTGSLGPDFRTGGYNHKLTGRYLDGNSPEGAALLSVSRGPTLNLGGVGVSWNTRDGTSAWATAGADHEGTPLDLTTVTGPDVWLSWNVTDAVQNMTSGLLPNVGFLLKDTDETTARFSTLSSRETGPALGAYLDITYIPNQPPVIRAPVPDQVVVEDGAPWSLALAGFADDPDTALAQLRWDLAGVDTSLYDYTGGNITGNHILGFQLKLNAYGTDAVTLFLFDDMGNWDSQALTITVTPVNDPPQFNPPTTLYVKRGLLYIFDFAPYVTDVDTPDSDIVMWTNSAYATVLGLAVNFSYPVSYPDPWDFVTLTADDGEYNVGQSLAIGVTDDTPPVLVTPLPDVTIREGQTLIDVFDLDDYFRDPDEDALFYSEGFEHVQIVIDQGDRTVDIIAVGDWNGVESGTIRAEDPTKAIAEDSFLVTVLPENDPPVIRQLDPFVVRFNTTYVFDLTPHVSDPDNALSDITIRTSQSSYVTVNGMVLTMLFPFNYGLLTPPYAVPLTIFANDSIDETFLPTSVTVGYDYPPELRFQLPDVSMFEDTPRLGVFALDLYFIDVDDSTIYYSSGQVNLDVIIDANTSSVDLYPAVQDWFGVETVTFRAKDDDGAYAEDSVKVTVRPVNDAPRFTEIPVLVSQTGRFFFNLRNYVEDVEGDPLSLDEFSSYADTEGFILVFSYPDGAREDSIEVRASDGIESTSAIIQVKILGPDMLMLLLPWLLALAAIAGVVLASRSLRTAVEHVFLIYGGGVPIVHLSRTLTADKDPDLVASMFTAIQSFMDESFHAIGVGELKSIELADHRVALARGEFVTLIVLYRGHRSSRIDRRAEHAVDEIEKRFRETLKDWNGDIDRMSGVKIMLERLYGAKDTGQVFRGLRVPDLGPKGGPSNGK